MGFQCGIVGLPNVGKSTLFNALTNSNVEAANYPFNTIEPNLGTVSVPDERFEFIVSKVNPKSKIPSFMEFVDIAGLVRGASSGEGLGNKFLSHIREVDAIAHVVRCFDDINVPHVDGNPDPVRDIDTINTELLLSDLEQLERAKERLQKAAKAQDKAIIAKLEVVKKAVEFISAGNSVRKLYQKEPNYEKVLREYNLITSKPALYVGNVDEAGLLEDNDYIKSLRAYAEAEGCLAIKLCSKLESELSVLSEDEVSDYLSELGIATRGLDLFINEGYKLLNLLTFFTAGEKEVRAWTIPKGYLAPEAAGKIHTDIQKGFIRAEKVTYDDFTVYQSLQNAKEAGKMTMEGKGYVVQDGDILYFRFNV